MRFKEVDGRPLAYVGEEPAGRPLDVLFWEDGMCDLFASVCDGGDPPRPEHMYGRPVPLANVANGFTRAEEVDAALVRATEAMDEVQYALHGVMETFEKWEAVRDAGRAALALHAAREGAAAASPDAGPPPDDDDADGIVRLVDDPRPAADVTAKPR